MAYKTYKELKVWHKAMELVTTVYKNTQVFPPAEQYGLTNQMRRAAISVPSNIAEGQGRQTQNSFLHYLSISYGSLMELETQVQIANKLGYLGKEETKNLLRQTQEIGKMLNGLFKSLSGESK